MKGKSLISCAINEEGLIKPYSDGAFFSFLGPERGSGYLSGPHPIIHDKAMPFYSQNNSSIFSKGNRDRDGVWIYYLK